MGSALSTFNDFMTATDKSIYTSPADVVNEAVKQNYLLRRFLKGKEGSSVMQGGKTINDMILFDEASTFDYYQPNETFTWQNPQVLDQWEINWRYCVDHMSWTDQEIELNVGGGLGKAARHRAYKNLRRIKEMRLYTSLLNGMEDMLFATPSQSEMEAAGGKKPYSIPCFINEGTNTEWGVGSGTDNAEAFDAGVMGIDGVSKTKWQNQTVGYEALNGEGAGDATISEDEHLFSAFDTMYLKLKFQAPPTRQEYFENDNLFRQFIACSRAGITQYMTALRGNQDRFAAPSRQDPAYLKPTYGGIELEYVANLDTGALYPQYTPADAALGNQDRHDPDVSTTPLAEINGTNDYLDGSRYYWINANYLNLVFHTKRYMVKHPVMTHPNQPFTHVQPVDCWMNFVCRSRQRQGLVIPNNAVNT